MQLTLVGADGIQRKTDMGHEQLTCYLCGVLHDSLRDQMDHVGKHFDEGMDMSRWKRPEESIAPESDMPPAADGLDWMDASQLSLF